MRDHNLEIAPGATADSSGLTRRPRKRPLATAVPMLLVMILALASSNVNAAIRWYREDSFTRLERDKLQHWVGETHRALEQLTAPLPFTVHVRLHRLIDRGEPVPWAHTRRGPQQGVDFYVDPAWPLDDFLRDWTAAHELSHLVFPYLGDQHRWFAEGFASYMQYQVLHQLGAIDDAEMASAYRSRITKARDDYSQLGLDAYPFMAAQSRLHQQSAYSVYYWGGAVYFMNIDAQLRSRGGPGLTALLGDYLRCCRAGGDDFHALIAHLDELAGSPVFTTELEAMRARKGFPLLRTDLAKDDVADS